MRVMSAKRARSLPLLLLPMVLSAAIAAAATTARDPDIAFTATAKRRMVPVAVCPHPEALAIRLGTWKLPRAWRWMSDSAQIAWMIENYVEVPLCRVVLRRRVSAEQARSVTAGSPPPQGRTLQARILALPQDPALPHRELVVPLAAPDGLQPVPQCSDDPRVGLRRRLQELGRANEITACGQAAAAAEARMIPLHPRLTAEAADGYRRCGKLPAAERILRTTVELFEENHPSHHERPQALDELGSLLVSQGRLAEGELQIRRAVDLALSVGVEGSDLAVVVEELAELDEALGQKDEAKRRWVQAIALYEDSARARGEAPARYLRTLGELQRARSQPRAAQLFAQRADQLALLGRRGR
jgi:hypothetical protein